MRHPSTALVLALALVLAPLSPAHAGARVAICQDCIMPPVPLPPPVLPGEPPRSAPAGVRDRLRALSREIGECALTHLEATPRTLAVHVFVYPSGEWGLTTGRARRPAAVGARGETPFEVCVADWVSSSLGSHTEPFRGRRPRDVAHTFRLR